MDDEFIPAVVEYLWRLRRQYVLMMRVAGVGALVGALAGAVLLGTGEGEPEFPGVLAVVLTFFAFLFAGWAFFGVGRTARALRFYWPTEPRDRLGYWGWRLGRPVAALANAIVTLAILTGTTRTLMRITGVFTSAEPSALRGYAFLAIATVGWYIQLGRGCRDVEDSAT